MSLGFLPVFSSASLNLWCVCVGGNSKLDGWYLNGIFSRYEEKAVFENPEAFPLALRWRIWNFSDLNPLLKGIEKQLKGNEEMLHGPPRCHLAPAGNTQASCGHPSSSPRFGVTNAAPNLAAQPLVAAQAPRTVPLYKYTSQPAVRVGGQEPLTASLLAAAPPQDQKQMLGDRLFPLIQAMQPTLAGKITGTLLDIDNSKLLHMLESPEALRFKEEAVAVLRAHQAKKEAA